MQSWKHWCGISIFLFDSQFLKMKRPQEIGNPNHDFLWAAAAKFLGKKISTPLPSKDELKEKKTPTQIKREFGSLIFIFPRIVIKILFPNAHLLLLTISTVDSVWNNSYIWQSILMPWSIYNFLIKSLLQN